MMRMLKWVGDPPVLKSDGWSVANWRYENRRTIVVPGTSERIINKSDDPRLTRSYKWPKESPDYVIPVEFGDAQVILERCPHEFVDVTNMDDTSHVSNAPIILRQ